MPERFPDERKHGYQHGPRSHYRDMPLVLNASGIENMRARTVKALFRLVAALKSSWDDSEVKERCIKPEGS